jgi:hypothetical protein
MPSLKMSVADWIAVTDNPIQRDTERHAAKAKHLLTPSPTHAHVSAAKLPDGTLVKLDGHTRALMWARGMVQRPAHVEVAVIPVKSIEDAKQLYTHFDSKDAVETAVDKISGGFRDIGFTPESGLLKSGQIGSALRIAWTVKHGYSKEKVAKNTYEMVNEFSAEILALDELGLGKRAAFAGIIAAFLLSYRKYDEQCLPFWRAVFGNAGNKINGKMDAVQALNELILARKRNATYGSAADMDLCSRALHAYEKYRDEEMLGIVPRPMNLTGYLVRKPAKRAALRVA